VLGDADREAATFPSPDLFTDEDTYDERVHLLRARFAEREAGSRERVRATTRQAYEDGRGSEWRQLIDVQPPVITDASPGLLESATADTYIAIDTRAPAAGT
jgi:hypothetical protein